MEAQFEIGSVKLHDALGKNTLRDFPEKMICVKIGHD